MTLFTPPYPKLTPTKSKLLRTLMMPLYFLKSRRCSLAMIPEGAYRMALCEVRGPVRSALFPLEPEMIRRVLIDDAEDFPKSELVADVLGLLLGDSIFVSNGEVWKRQRRMMAPAFEHTRVKVVFDMMLEAADAMVDRLDRVADGRDVNVEEEMTFVTADIIFRTIFSRPLQHDEADTIFKAFSTYQQAAFAHGLNRLVPLPNWMSFFEFRKANASASIIRGILDPIIRKRFDSFHAGEPQLHNDILQSLVSVKDEVTGTHFDFRELCEQVAMLFLAGHETSASALSSTLYLLTMDQTIQERVHAEATAALGARSMEFSDLRKLDLTRNVFAEAMRLFPPVPFLPRQAAKACPIRNKTATPGTVVSISPWLIQRHRKHWKDPDSFDPDRFDRPENKEAERQCYIPFSKGPRVCLGASFALQEATIILATLLRRYKFDPVPGFIPKIVGRLTVRSANGIRLRMSRRPASSPRLTI
jgi:cytochrome P450